MYIHGYSILEHHKYLRMYTRMIRGSLRAYVRRYTIFEYSGHKSVSVGAYDKGHAVYHT